MTNTCCTREDEVASEVVDAAFRIHRAIGPGLLEYAYEKLLVRELHRRGLESRTQVSMPMRFAGEVIEPGFTVDLMVEDCVLVMLKSVEVLSLAHHKQLRTFLKLSGMKAGLILNFGTALMKDGVFHMSNGSA